MKKRILAFALSIATVFSLSVMSVSASGNAATYYENTQDGSFYYSFSQDGDWTTKLSISNKSFVADDGINHSGMLKVVNKAGQGALSTGINAVKFRQGSDLVIRGKIRYLNTENLKEAKAYPALYVTGLSGAPLYTDAACTIPSDPATGGYYYINLTKDISDKTYIDGQWHEFETVIPSKGAKHSTGKYVDLTGISTNIWFRPYNSNSFTATTEFFSQDYLNKCTASGATPQVEVLLDDLEAYYINDDAVTTETVTSHEKILSFDTDANWKPNTNRAHETSWRGRNGVATATSPQSTSSSYTHTFDMKVREGEKLRISAELALGNPETLNLSKINANAVLIMNGGSSNNPAGFYEDEACTVPCTSVNGNAITLSATMLSGMGSDWNHFTYDFDTTKVIESTIKRLSSDSAKSTVYIKPWEIANISVWFRVIPGSATANAVPDTVFTQDYKDACAANGTTPSLTYGLDNIAVASVAEGDILPTGIVVDSITADKDSVMIGDTVNVTYTLAYGKTETESRVYVKADDEIIGFVKNANGAFSFNVPENLYGKNLSIEIAPASGTYSLNTYTKDLGIVKKVMFDASATENGVTWSYDASNDTENSVVIVALYNTEKEMIQCVPVTITAGKTYKETTEDDNAAFAKVFHWVDTDNAVPLETNFAFELN